MRTVYHYNGSELYMYQQHVYTQYAVGSGNETSAVLGMRITIRDITTFTANFESHTLEGLNTRAEIAPYTLAFRWVM